MTRPGTSRLANEHKDCWSDETAYERTRAKQKEHQGASSKSSKRQRESSEDSDEQTKQDNDAYDRREYPEKFKKWQKQGSAQRNDRPEKRSKTEKRSKKGRAKTDDRLEEHLARMERLVSMCLPMLPVVPVGVRASAETPKHKYTQDKKDDGKDLAKKVNHCHRQKESSEQQQRREEKRVKTLAKAITMSAWLFGGTFQLFDINLNSVPQ